jgi:hypothetical protein
MAVMTSGGLMEFGEKRALLGAAGGTLSPATFTAYLALLTAAPTATDGTIALETEYMGGPANGYARMAFGAITPTSASPSVIGNPASITFGPMTTSPGTTITWAVMCDAATGTTADLAAAFLLTNSRLPLSGDSLTAAINSFTITV